MRARYPDSEGFIERDGVRVGYERFGDGDPAILFLPTWAITRSRMWKGQVPYVSRHTRVITFDPRGNGRSDRPTDPRAHADAELDGRIGCPVLVIHGDSDVCDPYSGGVEVAAATGGRLVSLAGCGHVPVARYPVRVNLLIREFLDSVRASGAERPLLGLSGPAPGA